MKKIYTAPITHALLPLWKRCFAGETESEIRSLLDALAPDGMALYAEENGTPVCQGILLLTSIGGYDGYYLYALCTAPAKRGRGYMRALIEAAARLRDQNGLDFLLLIPANAELAAAYERLGFTSKLPLSADAKGEAFYRSIPIEDEETPFDGDYERLYLLSGRHLSYATFCVAMDSVGDKTEIFYTKNGFRVRSKRDPAFCFTADEATTTGQKAHSGWYALAMPREGVCLPTDLIADPLPR